MRLKIILGICAYLFLWYETNYKTGFTLWVIGFVVIGLFKLFVDEYEDRERAKLIVTDEYRESTRFLKAHPENPDIRSRWFQDGQIYYKINHPNISTVEMQLLLKADLESAIGHHAFKNNLLA